MHHRTLVLSSLLLLGAGCDRLRDLIAPADGGAAASNPQPMQPPVVQPVPTTAPPNTQNPSNTGTIQIPGMPGLNLPLPFPGGNNNPTPGGTTNTNNGPPNYASYAPPPPGSIDGYGALAPAFLRSETTQVFNELVAALGNDERARIQGIPFRILEDMSEANAAAGCSRAGRAFMVITTGLLVISAASAETKAYDELSGERRNNGYLTDVSRQIRARQPITGLAPGALPAPLAGDPRKLARQRFLFDEQVAFVLGHELAHHYRGHTGCANGTAAQGPEVTTEELVRVLSNTVPLFNQPLELDADSWGTFNVMDAGSRRAGGTWTEEGATMTLDFFAHMTTLGVETLVLGFLRTHPPPLLRMPVVSLAAQQWRNGQRPQSGTIGNLPIPIPIQLPFPQR